jgi:hypothetical protein
MKIECYVVQYSDHALRSNELCKQFASAQKNIDPILPTRDVHRAGQTCPALHPALPCHRAGHRFHKMPCPVNSRAGQGIRAGQGRNESSCPANFIPLIFVLK